MKEHPMLFQAPLVRSILSGAKTWTRRPVNPRPGELRCAKDLDHAFVDPVLGAGGYLHVPCRDGAAQRVVAPWCIGDRIWVRETWLHIDDEGNKFDGMGSQTYWRASQPEYSVQRDEEYMQKRGLRWRPSIHMPRWASRIDLLVVNTIVQRLQDITEEDAKAEGLEPKAIMRDSAAGPFPSISYIATFRETWDSIYRAGKSWDANPWVWAVKFRMVRP